MNNEKKSILDWAEVLLLNIFTIQHQLTIYMLLLGNSYDEEHKTGRIQQYFNFFIIITIIYLIIIISQIVSAYQFGNEPDYNLFGFALLFLFYTLLYNLSIYTIYVHRVSNSLDNKVVKNTFFLIIPILLILLNIGDFIFISFITSIYYLIVTLMFYGYFKKNLEQVPNVFLNRHINNLWSLQNFKKTNIFLVFILSLYSFLAFVFDIAKSLGQEIELPEEIIQQSYINSSFEISLLAVTIIIGLNSKKAHNNV